MTRLTLWSTTIGDVPANLALTNNFDATTNPGVGNDLTQNYTPGSVWINKTTAEAFICVTNAKGAANWQTSTTGSGTPGQITAPAASTPTGAGSAALITGGAGGTTSGNGGIAAVRGGSGTAGNGNGGSGVLQGGAGQGSGVNGSAKLVGVVLVNQGAPAAKTVSGTLAASDVLTGIVTVLQGAGAASAQQLPLATAMDTSIPDAGNGDAFDFSVINVSTSAAESASLTINTGWTLVGDMDVQANSGATTKSAGRFRARRTAAGAWTLYRLS